MSLEDVAVLYGLAYSYYFDCHSIFKVCTGKRQPMRKHYKVTDDVDPQVKKILLELGVKVRYTLSPQAKGKVERPYRWLQDRIVRTCAREGVTEISDGIKVLKAEADRYNYRQVHSVTGEVPYYRLKRLVDEGKSLFNLRIVPDMRSGMAEIRMWYKDNLIGIQKVKNVDINLPNFK